MRQQKSFPTRHGLPVIQFAAGCSAKQQLLCLFCLTPFGTPGMVMQALDWVRRLVATPPAPSWYFERTTISSLNVDAWRSSAADTLGYNVCVRYIRLSSCVVRQRYKLGGQVQAHVFAELVSTAVGAQPWTQGSVRETIISFSSKASGYTKPCLLADVSSSQNKRPSPCASRAPAATTCPTTRAAAKHRNVACRHVGANLKACSKALVDCLARSSPHHQEIMHSLSTARYLTGDTALLHPAKICSECLA